MRLRRFVCLVLGLVGASLIGSAVFANNSGIRACKSDDYTSDRIKDAIGQTAEEQEENHLKSYVKLRNGSGHEVGVLTFRQNPDGTFKRSTDLYLCGNTSNYNYNDLNLGMVFEKIQKNGVDESTLITLSTFESSEVYQDEALVAIEGVGIMAEDVDLTQAEKDAGYEQVAVLNLFMAVHEFGQGYETADFQKGVHSIGSFGRFQIRLPDKVFDVIKDADEDEND